MKASTRRQPIFNINELLASVEGQCLRSSKCLGNRLFARALGAYRQGRPKLNDADLWKDLNAVLHKSMVLAHMKGVKAYNDYKAKRKKGIGLARSQAFLKKVPKEQRQSISTLYSKFSEHATGQTAAKVRDTLLSDIASLINERPRAYIKQTRGVVDRLGLGYSQDNIIQNLVKTQTSIAFNAALWVSAKQDDELWGYEYTTAGDERVRETHVPFDGVRYPKDHEFWQQFAPPNGWRCRCTLNPIYNDEKIAKIRKFKGTPEVPKEFRFNAGMLFE